MRNHHSSSTWQPSPSSLTSLTSLSSSSSSCSVGRRLLCVGILGLAVAGAAGCRGKGSDASSSPSSSSSADTRGGADVTTASAKAPRAARSACDLLTKAEVEEVLETTVSDPMRRGAVCHFSPDGKPMRGVSLTVMWNDGKAAMQGASMAGRMMGSMMGSDPKSQEAAKRMFGATEDLQGLGDDASFQMVTLHVRKGDAYISIDARLCSRAQAIALARKAVERL